MRTIFGILMFFATAAFGAGLLFTLVATTWFSTPLSKGLIGFFGFGVPMIICAMATTELWWDSKWLLRGLGMVWGAISLALCAGLFVLIAGWVYGRPFPPPNEPAGGYDPRVWYLLSFGIPMVATVLFACAAVIEAERKG